MNIISNIPIDPDQNSLLPLDSYMITYDDKKILDTHIFELV